jgi:hypothetical protein
MNKRQLLWTVLAGLLILAAAALWFTRDQRQINGNLKRLQKLVSKTEEEKTIGGLIRAKEIAGFFAVPMNVALGAPWPDFADRNDLAAAVHYARSMVRTLDVTIRNKTLKIGPDRQSATMDLAAEAVVSIGGQTDRDIRELRVIWLNQQGRWLISRVELKETIRRPQGLGGGDF